MPPRNGQNPRRLAGGGTLEKLTTVSAEGARPTGRISQAKGQSDRAARRGGERWFLRVAGAGRRLLFGGQGGDTLWKRYCSWYSASTFICRIIFWCSCSLARACISPSAPDLCRYGASVRDAGGVRGVQYAGRQAEGGPVLLSGPDHCHRRSGGYRQHHWRLRCHPAGRAGGHLLDVDHRLFRHGHHLRRGGVGAGDPPGGRGRQRQRRAGVLYQAGLSGEVRHVFSGLFRRGTDLGAGLHGVHGAVQLHRGRPAPLPSVCRRGRWASWWRCWRRWCFWEVSSASPESRRSWCRSWRRCTCWGDLWCWCAGSGTCRRRWG